jgi:hypothetical protein
VVYTVHAVKLSLFKNNNISIHYPTMCLRMLVVCLFQSESKASVSPPMEEKRKILRFTAYYK